MPAIRLLLVGNSYTYFNDLSHVLMHVLPTTDDAGAAGRAAKLRIMTIVEGGMGLIDTCDDACAAVAAFRPDVVVLQDHSTTPAGLYPAESPGAARAETERKLREALGPALQQHLPPGATVLFFATWARPQLAFADEETRGRYGVAAMGPDGSEPRMLELLEQGYLEYARILREVAAGAFSVRVVPVGRAVYAARRALPDEGLADSVFVPGDRRAHPSGRGTFLAGLVLSRALRGGATLREPAYAVLQPPSEISAERVAVPGSPAVPLYRWLWEFANQRLEPVGQDDLMLFRISAPAPAEKQDVSPRSKTRRMSAPAASAKEGAETPHAGPRSKV